MNPAVSKEQMAYDLLQRNLPPMASPAMPQAGNFIAQSNAAQTGSVLQSPLMLMILRALGMQQ